ncbi:hypothetical protein [Phenylobacterium sp.]|uniref:terminase small subunit-like protein n=1 Tax=Phenylobacterium sp. TaxID=1871053 RepID=UPI0025CBF716|nr:hypothetical protein [Phenylobacterium sp.]
MATAKRASPGRARKAPKTEAGEASRIRYSVALGDRICARLAKGEPLYRICEEKGMPAYATVYAWERRETKFGEKLCQARQAGAEFCADRAVDVAENSQKETAQRDRLLVSTLLKRAALIAPRRTGGKTAGKEAGAEATPPVVFYIRRFERVVEPDGSVSVRELPPAGLE